MLLIGNGRLITRDSANPFFENGAVLIDGERIKAVGETAALRSAHPQAEFLDAQGGVIMPGLINAHNHIYSAFARGLSIKGAQTRNFLEILSGLWWTLDDHLLLPDTAASADAMYIECLQNGCTTIFDHHASYGEIPGSLFAIAERAKRFGVRSSLCYEVSERRGDAKFRQAVQENVDFIRYAQEAGGAQFAGTMGMHAQFTLSDDALAYCAAQNPEGAGYHIHVAEGIDDVTLCLKEHGKRPVFRLHDFGILGEKTICGHCTHVSEAEMSLLAETDCMIVHNPESNMGNAIGCPPVLRMFEKNLLIGLGTDGYTNDMLESYKVANILHKHQLADPTVAWGEIPTMLFEHNAQMFARCFGDVTGVLKPGALADVITLDYVPQTPLDASNINSHVLFGMSGALVQNTVIGGQIKMKRRELVGLDKDALLAHCREDAQALWRRINER